MDVKDWSDVERAALHDPILRAAVTLVELKEMTREEALLYAALALSDTCKLRERELVRLAEDAS